MRKLELKTPEKMLFALLRAALQQQTTESIYFQTATEEDWEICYRQAVWQGVMALAWDGLLQLPEELHPPMSIKFSWGLAVHDYEEQYHHYCKTAIELSELFKKHGIGTVILKGIGFSTYYPIPSHREGGDIDIYTYSANKKEMTDLEANALADKLVQELGATLEHHSTKHSNFIWKDVPIENHRILTDINLYSSAEAMNKLLLSQLGPQPITLLKGEPEVYIPSEEFNTLFIAYHAAQHYNGGLFLHHICDWAILLTRCGLQLPKDIQDEGYLKMVSALTEACNLYLGTHVPVTHYAGEGEFMMKGILYMKNPIRIPQRNKLSFMMGKFERMYYNYQLRDRMLNNGVPKHSFIKEIWNSIIFHLRNPKRIIE